MVRHGSKVPGATEQKTNVTLLTESKYAMLICDSITSFTALALNHAAPEIDRSHSSGVFPTAPVTTSS